MDGELTRRIELARIDARRRHQGSVLPEHLLGVVIDLKDVARALRDRGLDPVELRERLEMRFTSQAAVGGYRDGSDSPLSPELEQVIERSDTRSWLRFLRRRTILDELLLEPSIATLIFELRRGNDYRYLVERARALAVMSKHATIGLEHMFRVLLDLPSFIDAIERASGDSVLLRVFVDTTLTSASRPAESSATIAMGTVLRRVVISARAMARASDSTTASIRQLCLALARMDESAPFWDAAGIDASDFVRAVHLPEEKSMRARSLLR